MLLIIHERTLCGDTDSVIGDKQRIGGCRGLGHARSGSEATDGKASQKYGVNRALHDKNPLRMGA